MTGMKISKTPYPTTARVASGALRSWSTVSVLEYPGTHAVIIFAFHLLRTALPSASCPPTVIEGWSRPDLPIEPINPLAGGRGWSPAGTSTN